jgi:hypothetical protein
MFSDIPALYPLSANITNIIPSNAKKKKNKKSPQSLPNIPSRQIIPSLDSVVYMSQKIHSTLNSMNAKKQNSWAPFCFRRLSTPLMFKSFDSEYPN